MIYLSIFLVLFLLLLYTFNNYRYLCTHKHFVRNKSHPEGSIAERYIAEECVTFCSRYLHGIETRFDRLERNYDGSNAKSHHGLAVFAQLDCTFQNNKEKKVDSDVS